MKCFLVILPDSFLRFHPEFFYSKHLMAAFSLFGPNAKKNVMEPYFSFTKSESEPKLEVVEPSNR